MVRYLFFLVIVNITLRTKWFEYYVIKQLGRRLVDLIVVIRQYQMSRDLGHLFLILLISSFQLL